MKTFVVALLVVLAMQSCLIPSIATAPQTKNLATVSFSLVATASMVSVSVDANRRRRRRKGWNNFFRRRN